MATPTPGRPQVAATPPVSTPHSISHLAAFSPRGPRSVGPSPQAVKKSPANSQNLYGHPSNSSSGAMTYGAMNYDSPSAAAALGALPAMADLPSDSSQTRRDDEADRRRKLLEVLEILKHAKGHVSEEGLERLVKRYGLECFWEDQRTSRGVPRRTLISAGTALAIDVDFESNLVKKVTVSFPEAAASLDASTEKAGQILLNDLKVDEEKGESALTKMLDKFADNLERLVTLDKLSIAPGLNCHEAIAGIYESLRRLHEWEVSRLKEDLVYQRKGQKYLGNLVACEKSGRPLLHARNRIGLCIDYWQDKHLIAPKDTPASEEVKDDDLHIFSIFVECAALLAPIFPPVRISDNWLSPSVTRANHLPEDILMPASNGVYLDWQEPESIFLSPSKSSNTDQNAMDIEQDSSLGQGKLPEVMFVAKFHPPIVVSYAIAHHIYSQTGNTIEPTADLLDGLLLPHGPEEQVPQQGENRVIRRQRGLQAFAGISEKVEERVHDINLFVEKLDNGRTISELSFSHPKQLVEMLPLLRQYAFLSRLLQKTVGKDTKPQPKARAKKPKMNRSDEFENFMDVDSSPAAKSSAALLTSSPVSDNADLAIDISLSTEPMPKIQLVFPLNEKTAIIAFEVGLNGAIRVLSQNVVEEDEHMEGVIETEAGKGRKLRVHDMARMLEICEDFSVFVEYLRARLG